MALLEVKNIYKSFGGVKAIQNFSIEVNAGEIHGIKAGCFSLPAIPEPEKQRFLIRFPEYILRMREVYF